MLVGIFLYHAFVFLPLATLFKCFSLQCDSEMENVLQTIQFSLFCFRRLRPQSRFPRRQSSLLGPSKVTSYAITRVKAANLNVLVVVLKFLVINKFWRSQISPVG